MYRYIDMYVCIYLSVYISFAQYIDVSVGDVFPARLAAWGRKSHVGDRSVYEILWQYRVICKPYPLLI